MCVAKLAIISDIAKWFSVARLAKKREVRKTNARLRWRQHVFLASTKR